jgi:hypothetical protein
MRGARFSVAWRCWLEAIASAAPHRTRRVDAEDVREGSGAILIFAARTGRGKKALWPTV